MRRCTVLLVLLLGACSTIEKPESNPEPWDWDFGDYAADTAKLYGITWVWTFAVSEEFREGLRNFTWQGWWDNISQPPVWDDGSSDVTNNIWHPLAGAVSYGFMRARGYPFEAAASQVLLQSVLFEYTIEGIYTRPSYQDMMKTTLGGVTLGVIMDESARWLLKKESKTARVFGYLLNPMYLFPGMHGKPHPVQVQVNLFQPSILLTWRF